MWRLSGYLLLACCAFLGLTTNVAEALKKIEAPCTACKAVAAELQRRIDNEPVRNHLDLRHRLDKDGQRYGKVIAYRSSELRALELLDGLCDRMRDYSLVSPTGKRTKYWLKVKGDGANTTANVTRPSADEENERGKRLEAYCGTLVEDYEDEIYAGIMKGGFDSSGVESVLCTKIIAPCPVAAPVASGSSAEGESATEETSPEELEAAAAGAEVQGSEEGSRHIEDMTVKLDSGSSFEL